MGQKKPSRKKKRIEHDAIVARFGQRLREVRVATGLTQHQLAERSEVTLSYITRLEAGRSAPGIDLVARLAEALGTTPSDLLPAADPPDDLAVLREQIRLLVAGLVEDGDRQTLSLLAQVLARLAATDR